MRVDKRKRRKNGKLVEDTNYTGFFRLPWEFKERSVSLQTPDKQTAEKWLKECITVQHRLHTGEEVPSYLWGAPKKELPALLTEYLDSLKSKERGEKHINGVRVHVERLIKECTWATADAISQRSFESWLACNPLDLRSKTEKQLSAKTKKEYQSDAQAFTTWLVHCRVLKDNPLEFLKPITTKGKETKRRGLWTPEILRKFLSAPSGGVIDYRSAVFLLFKTSVRKSSLERLQWADVHIDIERPYIELLASNNKTKERLIRHIDKETQSYLLSLRPADFKASDTVLGYKIPNSTRLRKDLEALGIEYGTEIGDLDFHALRHTSATMFAANGAPVAIRQKLLGHKTSAMTDRYTIDNGINVAAELEKMEPLYEDNSWTDIGTGFADFSGHSESQADTPESSPEIAAIPLPVTPRHKEAPSVRKRLNSENGGESRIRTISPLDVSDSESASNEEPKAQGTDIGTDYALNRVVSAWDGLPQSLQAAILLIVESSEQKGFDV